MLEELLCGSIVELTSSDEALSKCGDETAAGGYIAVR